MKHTFFLYGILLMQSFVHAMENSKDAGKTPPNTPATVQNKESRRLIKGSDAIVIQLGYRFNESRMQSSDPLELIKALDYVVTHLPEIVHEEQMQEKK